jgi:hypothetical protein
MTTDSITCDKQDIEINGPTKSPKIHLTPSSINTYVFTIDWNATGINRNSVIPVQKTTDVYTIEGVKIRSNVSPDKATEGLQKGIYIIGGKKIAI